MPAYHFAFVVMPLHADYDSLFQIIKRAASDGDVYAERVDEQVFDTAVIDHVHNQISEADFVIAMQTDLNSNVMYEVGYCRRAANGAVGGAQLPPNSGE